jgi:signal transduction histidine kinase
VALVERRVRGAWLAMAGLALGAVAVAALVARALAGRLSRPVDALARAAARLGDGDFAARAARSGVTEIDAVARTLDATGERLGQLLARERAFSADASHQLRTPLAGLRLRLEAARLLPGADQRQAIDDALAEVDRLEAMVEQLLALARDVGPVRDRLDLAELFAGVDRDWHGRLAAAGRPLRLQLEPGLPPVRAAGAAIRQVLDVLVANAAEHGEGPIELRAERGAGAVRLEVRNRAAPGVTGPGRGRGLRIASEAVRDAGGSLRVWRRDGGVVASLDLPEDGDAAA